MKELRVELIACAIILVVLTIGIFIPKSFEGYYLDVNRHGDFPTYKVMNNWNYWQDTTAFISLNQEETIRAFNELRRER